jgi:hypothetical protein
LYTASGELQQRRHDPDAAYYNVGGEEFYVYGTLFVDAAATQRLLQRVRSPRGPVLLEPARRGRRQAVAMEIVADLKGRLPGLRIWAGDKAYHGQEIQAAYDGGGGVLAVVPSYDKTGKSTERVLLEEPTFVLRDGTKVSIPVFAYHAGPHVEVVAPGNKKVLVPCDLTKWDPQQNRDGSPRIYGEIELPDSPLIARNLRGARSRIRYDTTADDRKRKLNRPELLRPHPMHTSEYDRLYPARELIESHHDWKKEHLPGRSKLWWYGVGARRMHFDSICADLARNYASLHVHRQRIARESGASTPIAAAA